MLNEAMVRHIVGVEGAKALIKMTPQGARKAMEVERVRTVGARRT